eukprot:9652830-Alexandrium_andersonii.AAC.1
MDPDAACQRFAVRIGRHCAPVLFRLRMAVCLCFGLVRFNARARSFIAGPEAAGTSCRTTCSTCS